MWVIILEMGVALALLVLARAAAPDCMVDLAEEAARRRPRRSRTEVRGLPKRDNLLPDAGQKRDAGGQDGGLN
jgi:hypothetical protein